MNTYISARQNASNPEAVLASLFGSHCTGAADALFVSSRELFAVGVCGLPFKAPVMRCLFADPVFCSFADAVFAQKSSLLIVQGANGNPPSFFTNGKGKIEPIQPEAGLVLKVQSILEAVPHWAGTLEKDGSHLIDLKSPLPGPHFAVNLLLGNRIGYPFPLQTTPKSVVDRLGRGSFRSHAATQVLATRWDLRQEENGFPCNRQFFLAENGAQIFHSASPEDERVVSGTCRHGQNKTEITYVTKCGLEIKRTIFVLPQEKGMPLAVEAQRITIRNAGAKTRTIRPVYTGMFGPTKPGALQEDVLYSTIIMEGGVLKTADGGILAVSPSYYPAQDRSDRRFATVIFRDKQGSRLSEEFSLDYTEFTGGGSADRPAGLARLPNRLTRKGPGFFALAGELVIEPGETATVDAFTGLVSPMGGGQFDEKDLDTEVSRLAEKYLNADALAETLAAVNDFQERFSSFLTVKSGDENFSTYCSKNLPFQVLYQSFVSRSFAQTQKGYREIGFREIQDLFASLYYFTASGQSALVRTLILDWAAQVFEFGYANHNFFWKGKEAGKWSDDALWLHQAVGRYVRLTGDSSILDAEAPLADGTGKKRSLFETLKAALRYSTEISVGAHGLPLLDLADWNDCLKLDTNYVSGPEKEKIWKATGTFKSTGTESVMNAFLAVTAARELAYFADLMKDSSTLRWADGIIAKLKDSLNAHAWKGRNFTRLLLNQYPGFTHAGADDDGLATDGSRGILFLNSFSWSILSGIADEAQIKSMFALVKEKLKTPFGLKLVSPMDLSRVVPGVATSEYFPGDRENGAVFKHAAMMAVAAMFDAARDVKDPLLARELASEAWSMIDLACPVRSMDDPFVLAGNPRFCTQYNNSETGENIGPLLSGTATWMILSLMRGFGIEYTSEGLKLDPVLRESDTEVSLVLKTGDLVLRVRYRKGAGFVRSLGNRFAMTVDGVPLAGNVLSLEGRHGECTVDGVFHN